MPNLNPWQADLGTTQGRIVPSGWTPPEGTHAFVLGSDVPGVERSFVAGDYMRVEQSADLTGIKSIRPRVRVRPPSSIPAGAKWSIIFGVDTDGQVVYELDGSADSALTGETRDIDDVVINTSALSGTHAIRVTLRLDGVASTIYDVELPGVYLDGFALETSPPNPIVLTGRVPEPGWVDVPKSTIILFGAHDLTGADSLDPATLYVWVNGVLAIAPVAGVPTFQPGFDGPGSGFVFGIAIDPTVDFESLSVVTVRVLISLTSGPTLDETYSFTVVDATAPVLAEAFATAHTTIRVRFDEPVVMGDGTGASDALNPANYAVVLVGGAPAIMPEITAVTQSTDRELLLTCDIPMTRGATYTVIAVNVRDLFGNAIAAPNNRATFTGFTCQPVPGRDLTVWQWWQSEDRQGDTSGDFAIVTAILQEVIDLILCELDAAFDVFDPDTAPEAFLDLMLWDLGNPFPFVLNETEKRRLISVLVPIMKSKGTDPGIVNAIRFFLGLEVTIRTPWILDGGSLLGEGTLGGTGVGEGPGTFILSGGAPGEIYLFEVVSAVGLTDEERARITQIVRYMKRAGTRFRIVEPSPPPAEPNHLVLGLSRLSLNWRLH